MGTGGLRLQDPFIIQKMNKENQTWEQRRANEENLYKIAEKLIYTRRDRAREMITDLGKEIGSFMRRAGAVLGALAGVFAISAYYSEPSRNKIIEHAWEQLNNQPAIECQEESACDELKRIISENKQIIQDVAQRADVEPRELESLMAASYLNPHRRTKIAEGYRGTILLLPEKAGVSGSTLDTDLEQNLYNAALEYKALSEGSEFPEEAVGRFFAGDDVCKNSVEEAILSDWQCNRRNRENVPDLSGTGKCGAIEAHQKYVDTYNQITEMMKEEDAACRAQDLQQWRDSLPVLSPEDMEEYKKIAHAMTWYNNLQDPYAQEAVQLFFAYLNAGIARNDMAAKRSEVQE